MHRPHWAITNPTPEHRGQVDDEYLHSKVAEYLAHPQWQSDIVEWAMVDAMVWREMVAFRDHTASERPGRVGWMGKLPGRVAAAAIGFVAPIWWLLGLHGAHDPAADLWIILYAAALVIWADWRIRIVRKKVLGETLEAKAGKLLARMATACGELDGTTLSLTQARCGRGRYGPSSTQPSPVTRVTGTCPRSALHPSDHPNAPGQAIPGRHPAKCLPLEALDRAFGSGVSPGLVPALQDRAGQGRGDAAAAPW